VKSTGWLAVPLLLVTFSPCLGLVWLSEVRKGGVVGRIKLDRVNQRLHGVVVDHTHNHGADRRIWSDALCQRRDLYVYLPPGFDPRQAYPLVIWLHGVGQDEASFVDRVVEVIDQAIWCGQLPPLIIAAPDGSINGHACLLTPGSFYINSRAGRFEDYVMQDVWNFVFANYPIRPEPEAHVIAGASMGGGAAYNLGIKYRDRVKVVVGLLPPLNSRWVDCHGRYMANFDPCCWGWRTDFSHRHEVIGRFYCVVAIRLKQVIDPLYGKHDPDIVEEVSRENPIEMLDAYQLKDGELAMFLGYAGKDQFNIDAQAESFLFVARQRGLSITVEYEPDGKHDAKTAGKMAPALFDWLGPLLRPYSP
jgi:S-formylglutathione hydrolase FrmB